MEKFKYRAKPLETLSNSETWIYTDEEMPDVYLNHVDKLAYINNTPVYYDTVAQYTGLYDRNGVEIYEGAEVKYKNKWTQHEQWQIKYVRAQFVLVSGTTYFPLSEIEPGFIEVIGNT